jgi:hypothetical protein
MRLFIVCVSLLSSVAGLAHAEAADTFAYATCQKTLTDKTLNLLPALGFVEDKSPREGELVLKGTHRWNGLCVSDVRAIGVMGALMFTGKVCSAETATFSAYFGAVPPSASSSSMERKDGVIATNPATHAMVFRGEPFFEPRPDPTSKNISFFCAYRLIALGPDGMPIDHPGP